MLGSFVQWRHGAIFPYPRRGGGRFYERNSWYDTRRTRRKSCGVYDGAALRVYVVDVLLESFLCL
jgi:hypothetical protein